MDRMSLTKFRRRLSALLRRIRGGEAILVLDRNRPVAQLEPITHRATADDRLDRLDRLEAAGIVRRGRKRWRPDLLKSAGELPQSKRSVLEALLDERGSSH